MNSGDPKLNYTYENEIGKFESEGGASKAHKCQVVISIFILNTLGRKN